NQIISSTYITRLNAELAKNASNEPSAALKAAFTSRVWINSSASTKTKGTNMTPNGGKMNIPATTPMIAATSLFFEPPYILTKYLLAINSLRKTSSVNTAATSQNIQVSVSLLTRK